jgi:hypothetical protein
MSIALRAMPLDPTGMRSSVKFCGGHDAGVRRHANLGRVGDA